MGGQVGMGDLNWGWETADTQHSVQMMCSGTAHLQPV